MPKKTLISNSGEGLSSGEIRQSYLDFFAARGHTIVPSASLVPGTDETLLFTNAGMVQFKDVFLGTGKRPYSRAVDSQKCMRVAGKHNDLEDVGRDDTHHTFFEMLGNWSFGDYYKQEAISWAWELLTEVWGLPKDRIWATCFEDEHAEIPKDTEAADIWLAQPGFEPDHVLYFGREENFWEMADTGPCGPDSEIHLDRGPFYCNMQDVQGHQCQVNGECQRYLELWNLVFIQYNRTSETRLEPLPATHVDTGMGFERLVSVLQDVDSNYRTDLFIPLLDEVQRLASQTEQQREENLTPYRVIGDHARAAAFLIADGVVPGNMGRNYVCRMIIRRASRFGAKIGLDEPFLASVAKVVVAEYGSFYRELRRNENAILETITEEERRFQRTLDVGMAHFSALMETLRAEGSSVISGTDAFDLYATYGLPFEITRDLAQEAGVQTDEEGFFTAMNAHRLTSGGEETSGAEAEFALEGYRDILQSLQAEGQLEKEGVRYDPYGELARETSVVALLSGTQRLHQAQPGDPVDVILPATSFYIEAGGQVADQGSIQSLQEPGWEISIEDTLEPLSGLVLHRGRVSHGSPKVGDPALATVARDRRWDIMRNHTATHLLHAALRRVLGKHARQAGSLVAPDRLRFDFTHPHAMTPAELEQVEQLVNEAILANYPLVIDHKTRESAIEEGAMALFGETYAETVRTISIGDRERLSYELCGGTHVDETGVIGPFVLLGEGSVAAGIRRIEALTGRGALRHLQSRSETLAQVAAQLDTTPDRVNARLNDVLESFEELRREHASMRNRAAVAQYRASQVDRVADISVVAAEIKDAESEIMRALADTFRRDHPSGVAVFATTSESSVYLLATVSDDLVARGLHAGDLVKEIAAIVGGGGGGKATLAQAGGKNPEALPQALAAVTPWVQARAG